MSLMNKILIFLWVICSFWKNSIQIRSKNDRISVSLSVTLNLFTFYCLFFNFFRFLLFSFIFSRFFCFPSSSVFSRFFCFLSFLLFSIVPSRFYCFFFTSCLSDLPFLLFIFYTFLKLRSFSEVFLPFFLFSQIAVQLKYWETFKSIQSVTLNSQVNFSSQRKISERPHPDCQPTLYN